MPYLPGIHEPDQSAEPLWAGKPGTVVFAVAIGCNPNDKSGGDYRWWADRGFRVLVRLNNGWKPDGTIPAPALYEAFAQRCANYVAASQGCSEWIIGNEPNHEQEWPQGQPIRPEDYARCFALCRGAIKRVQAGAKVILAGPAPWNQASGDWLEYWRIVLRVTSVVDDGGADGLAIHAYTHGSDPSLITSVERQHGWLWHFRTYWDQLGLVPGALKHLPVDITEINQGDDAWVDTNTGWVQAAMREIDEWNKTPGTQKIRSVCLYRWPRYDQKYSFADKAGVQDDFREACKQGYLAPEVVAPVAQRQEPVQTYMPSVQGGNQVTTLLEREISADFRQRVPTLRPHVETPGRQVYRLIAAEYVPDGAKRFGPDHHILVDVCDEEGKRAFGVPVHFYWADGETPVPIHKTNEPYGVDYGMNSHSHSYGVWVGDSREASDDVFGMGLGTIEQPNWNHHVSYYLVFQRMTVPAAAQPQPMPQPVTVPALVHPIEDPALRVVSQVFGVNPKRYERFGLAGHNGVDFAVPVNTPIRVVDDGHVAEAMIDRDGYGVYAKIIHTWGESLYAHLSGWMVDQGQRVQRGQVIGYSGNSGNSTGPHLHFGLRVNPYTRGAPFDGYSDPLPYLKQATNGPFMPSQPSPEPVSHAPVRESYLLWFKRYGEQYAVEWPILAALAFFETKYDVHAVSPKGAQGLMQFMPSTWADMQTQLGVTDPFDPEQSIHAAAFYLSVIRRYLGKFGKHGWSWALAGYNWGMGYVSQATWEQVPAETQAYVNNILHLSVALKRWEEVW